MVKGNKKAVYAALIGNFLIAIFKLFTGFISNSSTMIAEGFHSFSDVGNQILLIIGINKSQKRADKKHQFGYGKVQFFYAFLVAMLLFTTAGILSFREGILKLLNPEPIEHITLIFITLAVAFIIESYALYTAYKELKEEMKENELTSYIKAIKDSKDPIILAVIFEDSLALGSIVIAVISITLAYLLNNPIFDAIGSILIGIILMFFAFILASETKKLLIGESVSENKQQELSEAITNVKEVNKLMDLRTMHLGPDNVMVTAEVNIENNLTTNQVENVIDKIEKNIKKIIPKSLCYIHAEGNKVSFRCKTTSTKKNKKKTLKNKNKSKKITKHQKTNIYK